MDRYSVLIGTSVQGTYQELAASTALPAFFKKVGADSFTLPKDEVIKMMTGFQRKEGYFNEKQEYSAPISVRYAPMHLHKLPTMPKDMLPFCSLSVNGIERRDEVKSTDSRETFYSQTFFIGRVLMQKSAEGLCYLDQIFGTKLISGKDIQDYKLGRTKINLEAKPVKVYPAYRDQDKMLVLRVLELLYRKKNVVIRLEKEASVNSRSWDLLTQIYGMMQPRLATEYGFSTYSDQQDILKLTGKTSVKIFLVSEETQLAEMPADIVIINLNEEKNFEPYDPAFHSILSKWYAMDWERRREALEALFNSDTLDYTDPGEFKRISEEFFRNYEELIQWAKSTDNEGKLETLAELRKIKEKFTVCSIGWCDKIFNNKLPKLLKPGVVLESLAAKVSEVVCYASKLKTPVSSEDAADFKFIRTLDLKDNTKYFYEASIEHWDADAVNRLKKVEEQHAAEMASLERRCQETLRQKEEACQQELQKKTLECDDIKNRCTAEMIRVKTQCEAKITELNTKIETLKKERDDINTRARVVVAEKEQTIQQLSANLQTSQSKNKQLEGENRELKDENRRLKESGYSIQEPENPMKKWIMMGIGLAAGLLLMGMIWLVVALVGGQAPEETTVPTASIVETTEATEETTVPTETTEATEETTEATTIPTEPEPVDFTGWEDENLANNMTASVEGVTCATRKDQWYTTKGITIPAGYELLVAFTANENAGEDYNYPTTYSLVLRQKTAEEAPDATETTTDATGATTNTGASTNTGTNTNTGANTNTGTNTNTGATTGAADGNGEEPAEKLTTEEWLALNENVSLVMETEDYVIVTVGREGANAETAFQAARWFAGNTPVEATVNYVLDENHTLNLNEWTEKLSAAMATETQGNAQPNTWWYTVKEFTTDSERMTQLKGTLNTNPVPVFAMEYAGNTAVFFNYGGDADMAKTLEGLMTEKGLVAIANDDTVAVVASTGA